MSDVLRLEQAAQVLGIDSERVIALIADGKLPGAYRLGPTGSPWRIPRADVEALATAVEEAEPENGADDGPGQNGSSPQEPQDTTD